MSLGDIMRCLRRVKKQYCGEAQLSIFEFRAWYRPLSAPARPTCVRPRSSDAERSRTSSCDLDGACNHTHLALFSRHDHQDRACDLPGSELRSCARDASTWGV